MLAARPMQPGDMIAGKYRIDRILGEGGMGVVVAATNVYLDQRVALKFLLPDLLQETTVVERFLREARASARLRGEHVCRVYDVGTENGAPFMVMELLDGRDLASILSSSGKLPVSVAADSVLQAAIGLAEAHALGIIHRDLKPANLFVTKRSDGTPLVKIVDFGIAKAPTDTQFQLTRTAAVIGSPGYMSPEQLRSTRDADARSDIWALGVILYELVAGHQPFLAESITELALKVAMDPTPPLPGVPRGFEQVVARCLEKDPRRRFADVSQLTAALAPFGSKRIAEAAVGTMNTLMSGPALALPAPAAPTTLGSSAGSLSLTPGGRGLLHWLLFGGIAAVAITAVALVTLGGSEPSSSPRGADVVAPVPPAAAMPASPPPAGPSSVADTPMATAPPSSSPQPAIAPPRASTPPSAAPKTPSPLSTAAPKPAPPPPTAAPKPAPSPTTAAPKLAPSPATAAPKSAPPSATPPKVAPSKSSPSKTSSPKGVRDVGESRE